MIRLICRLRGHSIRKIDLLTWCGMTHVRIWQCDRCRAVLGGEVDS